MKADAATVGRRRIFRNSAFNLAGAVFPAAAAVLATPFLIGELGAAGFGVLSLQIAVLVLFGVNDFGISRAVVLVAVADGGFTDAGKRVEVVRAGAHLALAVAAIIAVGGLAGLGVAAAFIAKATDVWVSWVIVLAAAAVSLPGLPLRASLEVEERFGVLNVLRALGSASLFLGPLAALHVSPTFTGTAAALLITRLLLLAGYMALVGPDTRSGLVKEMVVAIRAWRTSGRAPPVHARLVERGWWLGVGGTCSTLLAYADRFVLAAVAGAAVVSDYVVANELATKLWLLTGALIAAATPRVATSYHPDTRRIGGEFAALSIAAAAICLLFFLVLAGFGEQVLRAWIGAAYRPDMARLLSVLALAVSINGMSQLNYMVLLIAGRERHAAVLQIVWLPLTLAATFAAARWHGAEGVAWVFAARAVLDLFVIKILLPRDAEGQSIGLPWWACLMWPAGIALVYAALSS